MSVSLWCQLYDHPTTRAQWNGRGQYLELQKPDEHSKMRKPYIYIKPVDGEFVPWVASQTDLLGEDWEIFSAS